MLVAHLVSLWERKLAVWRRGAGLGEAIKRQSRVKGIENPCVGGSIPPRATKIYIMPCFVRGIFF